MAQGTGSGAAPGGDLGDRLAALPRWWLGEMRDLVPESFKARAASAPAAFGCSLFADGRVAFARLGSAASPLPSERDAMAPSDLLAAHVAATMAGTRRRSVRLSVPASLCLVRRVRIPLRALSHAGAILRGEIEDLMPLGPSELLSDWYVETEDPETRELLLVQVVLARARIAEIAEILGGAGLTLTRLTVGEAEGRAMPVDLMNGRDPTMRAFLARLPRGAKAAVALALALFAAVPFVLAIRQEAVLDALLAERAALASSAASARSGAAVAAALESFGRRPPAAVLLDDIARRLPSDVHLTRFQLGEGEVALVTEGGEADRTRAALAASPFFSRVAAPGETPDSWTLTLAAPGGVPAAPGEGA